MTVTGFNKTLFTKTGPGWIVLSIVWQSLVIRWFLTKDLSDKEMSVQKYEAREMTIDTLRKKGFRQIHVAISSNMAYIL